MPSADRTHSMKAALGALWIVTVLEAAVMLLAGSSKFTGAEFWADSFVSWGYPAWFALVVGGAEMAGALLLLVPRLAAWAGIFLSAIMFGALGTVIVNQSELGVAAPLGNLAALLIITAARWGRRWSPARPKTMV